ncbi:MAG: ribosome silencing factor [Oscillospiraceae bacterium]
MEALELAKKIVGILDNKKAQDIKLLKVEDLTVLADYFVIASGSSSTQVGALTDEVDFQLGQAGVQPLRIEGAKTRSWVLLDYGAVVVHIFYPEQREFYALERMWADAETVEIDLD